MNSIDSCGWLEYWAEGPNAGFFARPLSDPGNLLVPTITIYEIFRVMMGLRGQNKALESVAIMRQGRVVDLDQSTAIESAAIGLNLKLPLADSIILATARLNHATLWTQDAHFRNVEGVRYVARK
jgi:predicted nucleic acid-binding protein